MLFSRLRLSEVMSRGFQILEKLFLTLFFPLQSGHGGEFGCEWNGFL